MDKNFLVYCQTIWNYQGNEMFLWFASLEEADAEVDKLKRDDTAFNIKLYKSERIELEGTK